MVQRERTSERRTLRLRRTLPSNYPTILEGTMILQRWFNGKDLRLTYMWHVIRGFSWSSRHYCPAIRAILSASPNWMWRDLVLLRFRWWTTFSTKSFIISIHTRIIHVIYWVITVQYLVSSQIANIISIPTTSQTAPLTMLAIGRLPFQRRYVFIWVYCMKLWRWHWQPFDTCKKGVYGRVIIG